MWNKEVTIKSNASREQIWNVWIDVNNWRKWDKEIKSSYINGAFKVGTYGVLKPLKGPQSKFKIVSVTKD
ncbi:MAG: polyketide cyclase, partial [Candidatus Delongbacteria bacterium]